MNGLGQVTPMDLQAQLNMQAANMAMPNPRFQGSGLGGTMSRANIGLQNGLGRLQQGMFQIDPTIAAGMSPEQIKSARNNAMLQMGLGMMGAAGQGAGLGESLGTGYFGAQNNLQGAMQKSYQNSMAAREEARGIEREQVEDERYGAEWERQLKQDELRQRNLEADRGYTLEKDKLAQGRWETELDADQAYRREQLGLGRARLAIDEASAGKPSTRDIDRLRAEYDKKRNSAQASMQQADNILQLAANPNIGADPSAQTALVMSFGKMLDPESVVREGEYKILEQSRGFVEQLQNILPRLQQGARLTPQQVDRMVSVARLLSSANNERTAGVTDYYNQLASRRGIDAFEVTGTVPSTQQPQNVINVGGSMPRGLGQPPQLGIENGRVVEVPW